MTTCPSKCSARIPESSLIALIISYCTSKPSGNHAVPTSTVPRIWPFLTPSTTATLIWTITLLTCRFSHTAGRLILLDLKSDHITLLLNTLPELASWRRVDVRATPTAYKALNNLVSILSVLTAPQPQCLLDTLQTHRVHLHPQGLCGSAPCACSALLPESHGVKFLTAFLKCQALKIHPI